jgi:hypothetical protein
LIQRTDEAFLRADCPPFVRELPPPEVHYRVIPNGLD